MKIYFISPMYIIYIKQETFSYPLQCGKAKQDIFAIYNHRTRNDYIKLFLSLFSLVFICTTKDLRQFIYTQICSLPLIDFLGYLGVSSLQMVFFSYHEEEKDSLGQVQGNNFLIVRSVVFCGGFIFTHFPAKGTMTEQKYKKTSS